MKPKKDIFGQLPLIRFELNLFQEFIFFLDKKKKGKRNQIVYTYNKNLGPGVFSEVIMKVDPSTDYGIGGPFDFEAFRAVEKILSDIYKLSGKLVSPIKLGSERAILRLIGRQSPSQRDHDRLKLFFRRTASLHVYSEYVIHDTGKGKKAEGIINFDPVYKHVFFTYDKLPDGTIADAVYLVPGELYLENLNNQRVVLIDRNFYDLIKGTGAKRLYEVLIVFAHKYEKVYDKYSAICRKMNLTRRSHLGEAKKQLEPYCRELKELGFLNDVTWKRMNGNQDWRVDFNINQKIKKILPEQGDLPLLPGSGEKVSRVSNFKKHYSNLYQMRFQKEMIFSDKDEEIIKNLVSKYKDEISLLNLATRLFQTTDPYLSTQSFALSFFASSSVINKLQSEIGVLDAEKKDRKKDAGPPAEGVNTEDIKRFNESFCKT